ncbi:MAG: hypothetical protein EAZ92_04025 [Candidatus Kapaibacterium sp.]|nr:MAG: hypothetical protein EAZ92_04025 [Candidatus Kapabacteria bacterium]
MKPLTLAIIFFGTAHVYCLAQQVVPVVKDSLEIRSGADPKNSFPKESLPKENAQKENAQGENISTKQAASVPDTIQPLIRKRTREEILRIPLEELLDLPMETVLEYAKVIDSIRTAQQPGQSNTHSRTSSKKRTTGVPGVSLPSPSHTSSKQSRETQTLDKFNKDLQHLQEQRHQKSSKTGRSTKHPTREELLRMKLRDLMDMRLGEILKLVNPVLASTATSSGSRRK